METVYRFVLSTSVLLLTLKSNAQISPPGLDHAHTAAWIALGIEQNLSERWTLKLYAGTSGKSTPINYSPVNQQAIRVINQETQYKFNSHWALGLCTSFRKQNQYNDEKPFHAGEPAMKNEGRYYLRLYYKMNAGRSKLSLCLRPELRTFYEGHNAWNPVDEEVRVRLKGQWGIPLDDEDKHELIIGEELLMATDHNQAEWTQYGFSENRISTYYRYSFKTIPVLADIGIMHQVKEDGTYIAHFAFDLILVNIL